MGGDHKTNNDEPSPLTVYFNTYPLRVYGALLAVSVCYFGKYYCTSDMYVAQKLFQESEGVGDAQLAALFAMGYVSSAFGKIFSGPMSDKKGGKFVLVITVIGYICCTVIFALVRGSLPIFYAVWFCNSFFALGVTWVAVVAMTANWIPTSHTGRLTSYVSLAPQIGDFLARPSLAPVIATTGSWRVVFLVAAGVAAVISLPTFLFVPNEPTLDTPTQETNQEAGQAATQATPPSESFWTRLKSLLRKPLLYVVAALSGCLYGIRAIFLLYATTYLAETYCRTYGYATTLEACVKSDATITQVAFSSCAYTIFGCISVLGVGQLKDRLPQKHRAGMISVIVFMLACTMAFLTWQHVNLPYRWSVLAIAVVGLTLFGPYKVLGTAFAIEIGGKRLKATACAVMGISDNLTAVIVLVVKGFLSDDYCILFAVLWGMSVLAFICALIVWRMDLKRDRAARALLAAQL